MSENLYFECPIHIERLFCILCCILLVSLQFIRIKSSACWSKDLLVKNIALRSFFLFRSLQLKRLNSIEWKEGFASKLAIPLLSVQEEYEDERRMNGWMDGFSAIEALQSHLLQRGPVVLIRHSDMAN